MTLNCTQFARTFVSKMIPALTIVALAGSLTAQAEETPAATTTGVPASTIAAPADNNIDPTKDVAGGVGEAGFKAPEYAIHATGKTLPKGIFRARWISADTFGSEGFTEDGKKQENGLTYQRFMTGLQLEYGLTKSVSLAMGVPFVVSNKVTMDGDKFANTNFYQKYFDYNADQFAEKLKALCAGNKQTCLDQIKAGTLSFPGPGTTILPTGETSKNFTTSQKVNKFIEDVILSAARPSAGETGIGDLQMGFLWSAISEDSPIRHVPLYLSVGGGMRFPTGKFNIASAARATGGDGTLITGGGTFDAIGRVNLDYVLTPGVILSWQHQMDWSITSAKLDRSSMLDPTQKNTANPSYSGPTGKGDAVDNELTFKRKGLHHIGFVQAAWGLGNISEKMKWLGLYSQAKYNIAAQAYLNDMPVYAMGDQFYLDSAHSDLHKDFGYEQYYSATIGTKLSGLPYMIPVELGAEFEIPFAGKNRIISPMNAQVDLSVYF